MQIYPQLLHVVDTVDEAVDCVVAKARRLRNGDDEDDAGPGAVSPGSRGVNAVEWGR